MRKVNSILLSYFEQEKESLSLHKFKSLKRRKWDCNHIKFKRRKAVLCENKRNRKRELQENLNYKSNWEKFKNKKNRRKQKLWNNLHNRRKVQLLENLQRNEERWSLWNNSYNRRKVQLLDNLIQRKEERWSLWELFNTGMKTIMNLFQTCECVKYGYGADGRFVYQCGD